jgi:hypothetical protein
MESTSGGSAGLRGALGFAAGRLAAGLRFTGGLRVVDAGFAAGDAGLRAVVGFALDDDVAGADSSSPDGCAPVPGSGEESTVKPYQSGMGGTPSITKRQHQRISSQLSSLFHYPWESTKVCL